jgi:hypothetical protein
MSTEQHDFFNYVVESKVKIEKLAEEIGNQLTAKKEQIRAARRENPDAQGWRTEMAVLQKRYVSEPEEAMQLLCAGIEERTGLNEVFKRNTEATNKNLKGEEWAKYILGCH